MRLLVTGTNGFIGTNFYRYMFNQSVEDKPEIIRQVSRSYGTDLSKPEECMRAFDNFKPTHVINFASETHIDTSIKEPMKFWDNNLGIIRNVLEGCRKHDCRLIQISSSEVYGTGVRFPMDENHPLQPHSPYAFTKTAQDRAVYSWFQTYGLNASIVRPFNQYGAYQQKEKVIPKYIYNVTKGLSLPVYAEGKARRDWLYVKDTVRGIWSALNKLPKGEIVNLATNASYSVIELADMINKTVQELYPRYKGESLIVTVDHVDDREGHVYHLEGSYQKAERVLGWKPEYDLHSGLKDTIRWYIDNNFEVPIYR